MFWNRVWRTVCVFFGKDQRRAGTKKNRKSDREAKGGEYKASERCADGDWNCVLFRRE